MTPTQQHALAALFQERIKQLVEYVEWFRTVHPSLKTAFDGLDQEYRRELRALLALRRRARNIARIAEYERTRAVDAAVDRVLEAAEYPVDREGDPAFNGAFSKW